MDANNGLTEWLTWAGVDGVSAGALVGGLSAKAGVDFGQGFNRMTVAEAEIKWKQAGDPEDRIRRAGKTVGRVVSEEAGKNGGPSLFAIKTRAGWLNLNPAWLVLAVTGQGIRLVAMAREGLINQKTAAGALARFEKAFREVPGA